MKNLFLPTYLPYFFSDCYRKQTISFLGLRNTYPKTGLSKPKMPVAKFELPVAKYFYRLPPGGVLMVQILSTRGHLVHSLHTRGSSIKTIQTTIQIESPVLYSSNTMIQSH